MKIKLKQLPGGAWRARVPGLHPNPNRVFVLHDDDPALAADVSVERRNPRCATAMAATKERAVALAVSYALSDLAFRITDQRYVSGNLPALEKWLVDTSLTSLFVSRDDDEEG
jgi:hypothetical protein